jgi:polyhydroxyalkanoate synthesis regulator phasin
MARRSAHAIGITLWSRVFPLILTIPLLEFAMTKSSQAVATAVNSVVASAVAESILMLHGKPASDWDSTIFQLGFDSCKAVTATEIAERTLAQCQTAMFDLVKGLPYVEFQYVRNQFIAGGVDSGKTAGASEQVWDKQVNAIVKSFGFVRPKSEAKDAKRKAEAEAKRVAEFGKLSDDQLKAKVDELVAVGSKTAMTQAAKVTAEIEKRNKPILDAEQVARKATVDKIIERVREVAKAKTADADALLTQVALLLG